MKKILFILAIIPVLLFGQSNYYAKRVKFTDGTIQRSFDTINRLATVKRLNDSLAAVRADFPTGSDRTIFSPSVADGATAVAYTFDTQNNLTTTGAKHTRWMKAGTELVSIDKDGNILVDGYAMPKFRKVTATLSSAQILAGTVVTVLTSPGAGKYINIVSGNCFYKHGGTSYVGDYYILLDYVNTLNGKNYNIGSILSTNSTSTSIYQLEGGADQSSIDNKGLYLGMSGTPTTGNGTVKLDLIYTIEDY